MAKKREKEKTGSSCDALVCTPPDIVSVDLRFNYIYKSFFTKLVVAKKRKKNIHAYKYGEKQQNKTKYREQV